MSLRKILLVHSGNTWSTHDVYMGILAGLKILGIEVIPYRLDKRITWSRDWIDFVRRKEGIPDDQDPVTLSDTLYQAAKGAAVRALEEGCDGAIIVSGLLFEQRGYMLLRRARIPILLFGTESPYEDDYMPALAPLCHVVTVNDPASVAPIAEACEKVGAITRVAYSPLGYMPEVHTPKAPKPSIMERLRAFAGGDPWPGAMIDAVAAHDVVFVGTGFPDRIKFLEAVDWTGIDLGLYGFWDGLDADSPLRQYIRGDITPNPVTAALYRKARVVLNLFRVDAWRSETELVRIEGGTAINPRLIEAAACGASIISEWRPEVADVFGDLIPTFKTPEECSALLRMLLVNEHLRKRQARELPKRVAGYSYHARAAELVDLLEDAIAPQSGHPDIVFAR